MAEHFKNFFDFFKDYEDRYVIIGGQAASILLEDGGTDPRATRDLDIIVIFERADQPFLNRLKQFLSENHYTLDGRKDEEDKHYYRFKTDKGRDVPEIIELFSKLPVDFPLQGPINVIMPLDDENDSLSAITLDSDYYQLLKNGVTIFKPLNAPVLKPEYLILFKVKAQLDITRRLNAHKQVNRADKNKHKTDIYRLLTILPIGTYIPSETVAEQVKTDLHDYTDWLQENNDVVAANLASLKLARFSNNSRRAAQEVIELLSDLIHN
jgi:hypothetical protein